MTTFKDFYEDVRFFGRVFFRNLPDHPVSKFQGIALEPVTDNLVFKSSGTVVTITNFVGGSDGQVIRIKGDGTTIVSHNTHIKTNTLGNKTLLLNQIYVWTYFDEDQCWYEDVP